MPRAALVIALVLGALCASAAAGPDLVVQPANGVVDFGFMIENTTSAPQRIVITNVGDAPPAFPAAAVCCGPFAIVGSGGSLGPGESAFWDIVASPVTGELGSVLGLFDFTFTSPSGNDLKVEVELELVVRRTPFDAPIAGFAPIGPGTTAHRTITVTNTSAAPKTITAISVAEPAFTVALHTGSLPLTVPSLGAFDLDVAFASTIPRHSFDAPIDAMLADGSTTKLTDAAGSTTGLVSLQSAGSTIWNGVPLGETWVRIQRLVNFGDTAQTVTGITFSNASEFGLTGVAVGDVLPPHSSRTVQTTFTPAALGDRGTTGQLTFSAADDVDAGGSGAGVSALVAITTGDAAPDDGVLDFGDLELGGPPVTRQLTITNISGQTLSTNSCEEPRNSGFSVTADCPDFTTLAPGASFQLGVVFTPAQVGDQGNRVTFSANGINHTLEMPVYARVVSHGFALSADALAFADTARFPSTPTLQDLVVTNTGTEPLALPAASISGDGFAIVTGPGAGTLLPGAAATYTIGFAPTAEGAFDATLALGALATIPLHGTGTLRAVTAESELEFSSVVIGRTAVGSITIHNAGTAAVTVSALASTDPRFVATLPADPSVPPGGDLVVSIAYSPTLTGNDDATLNIFFDRDPEPQLSVALHGLALVHGGGGCSTQSDSGGAVTVLLVLLGLRRRRR